MIEKYKSVFLASIFVLFFWQYSYAQNPLGIGTPEQIIKPEGPFAPILFWVQQQQKEFYRSMTEALQQIKSNGTGGLILVGLSFAYGLLHAAGPGHGKTVISSYILANEVALRRGIVLSFASSFLQGLTAIIAISSLLLFLRGAGFKSKELTHGLEIASYAAITVLGAWMLYSKIFKRKHSHSHNHDNEAGHVCGSGCGHLHAPDPKMLSGKFGWQDAYSAILAVGLRPCSGALIVLTFAFLNGMYVAGIGSVFAMSLGTGLMVSLLASIAVLAKNYALKLSGATKASDAFYKWVEIAGAGFVFAIGVLLLSASLQ